MHADFFVVLSQLILSHQNIYNIFVELFVLVFYFKCNLISLELKSIDI